MPVEKDQPWQRAKCERVEGAETVRGEQELEREVEIYEEEATELCSIHMVTVLCEYYSCLQPSGSYKSKHDCFVSFLFFGMFCFTIETVSLRLVTMLWSFVCFFMNIFFQISFSPGRFDAGSQILFECINNLLCHWSDPSYRGALIQDNTHKIKPLRV